MQVTITRISDKERVSQRTGKPFTSRSIQTNEHGSAWLSGFAGKDNAGWKVGDTVEVEVETKGEYLNFTVPKGSFQKGGTAPDINRLERKVDAVMTEVQMIRGVLGEILQKVAPITSEPNF